MMKINDIAANQGNISLLLDVIQKEEPRTFEKFGKQGKVCTVMVSDDSGRITLTLWNDNIDLVKVGDKIQLENGWCSEFRGEKQLSTGKFGTIEVVGTASLTPPSTVTTQKESTPAKEHHESHSTSNSSKPLFEEKVKDWERLEEDYSSLDTDNDDESEL